jgi:hypothetical protein
MQFLLDTHRCTLCGSPIALETCSTDEFGQAVHENCYVDSLRTKERLRRERNLKTISCLLGGSKFVEALLTR